MSGAQTYGEFAPTPFESAGAFLPDRADWTLAPVSTNRDAEALTRSNWEEFQRGLSSEVGEDSPDWELHRFGHWGPGWYEVIILRPGTRAASYGVEVGEALADYPVIDEEAFSALEAEEACESWDSWAREEAWSELEESLPPSTTPHSEGVPGAEFHWDRDEALEARGLTGDEVSAALWEGAKWESHSDGPSFTYDASLALERFPALSWGADEVAVRAKELAARKGTAPLFTEAE